jgi:peptide/nickel transport system substrate-binding protein
LVRWLSSLLLILLAAACAPDAFTSQEAARTTDRLIYGLTLQPSGFDPHIHASSELGIPLRQVYDTLIYRDPVTREFVAGLAREWSVSPDGLVYTFNLRQDVVFHDGNRFNAQAVAANLERILAPETGSQRAVFLLGPFARYELVDEFTIRIILAEPYAPLLDSLSQVYLGMASPSALQAYSADRYQFHQVGTGPYRFVEYIPGDRLVLRKNTAYAWGPAFYPQDLSAAPDEIEFRFFTDPPTRTLALESGDVHIIGEIPPRDARALSAEGRFELVPVNIPGQPLQFLFNTRQYPTDNVLVRQALLYATNRSEIIDTVFQRFSPIAWGPLAAATPFFNSNLIGIYSYDSNRARSLLAEAGFTDTDENGFLEFGGAELTITVIVPPWGQIPEVAQFLQDQWRDVGIRTILNPVPSRSTLIEAVNAGGYNLVAFYEFGTDPSFLTRYFSTDGVNNWSRFSDPRLDQLLLDAERAQDLNARFGLYSQAQQLIMEQALILPVRDYVNLNAAAPNVSGLAYDAYGWFPLIPALSFSAN